MKNLLIGLGALAMGTILLAGDAAARGGGGHGGGMGGAAVDRGVDTGMAGAGTYRGVDTGTVGAVGSNRYRSRCQMVPVRRGTQTEMVRRC